MWVLTRTKSASAFRASRRGRNSSGLDKQPTGLCRKSLRPKTELRRRGPFSLGTIAIYCSCAGARVPFLTNRGAADRAGECRWEASLWYGTAG